ncbi:MAG: ABC transporter ATP-binding protein [Dehalococcoidia bacterium]|nr:ABC transporter ATP-binding protein [Dehalococcoidia bacterium]
MSGAEIDVRNVSRHFLLGAEDVWAVRDVSLHVDPGEFLALVGRSGSGKTTLMNLVGGLDRPSEGEVLIDGERVDTMSEKQLNELRRHTIGVIFQSFGLLPLLSAQENVELPLRIAGSGPLERGRRAREVLDMVGLNRRRDHRPYELSGGEQQRVAIARALATAPRLILADEPTGELDSATAVAVFGLMRELSRTEGITILTCTHDRLVMEQADRIEELADGRLLEKDHQQVWQRVSARESSPFAAWSGDSETAVSGPRVSSLVGADVSLFSRQERTASQDGSNGHAPAEDSRDEDDEDKSRWARPE